MDSLYEVAKCYNFYPDYKGYFPYFETEEKLKEFIFFLKYRTFIPLKSIIRI